jgi:hypothetical protein
MPDSTVKHFYRKMVFRHGLLSEVEALSWRGKASRPTMQDKTCYLAAREDEVRLYSRIGLRRRRTAEVEHLGVTQIRADEHHLEKAAYGGSTGADNAGYALST